MPITRKITTISDVSRDAKRHHRLLLALNSATDEVRRMETVGYPDIDEVLGRLLPDLAGALNAEQAFVAWLQEDKEKKWLELTAAYPREDLRGRCLEWSEPLQQLVQNRKPKVIDPLGEEVRDFIPGLEIFEAISAILVRMQAADRVYIVGVCNKTNPDLGPFLAADGMALGNIVELMAIGARVGERRRRELEGIQKTSAAISAELDLDELLPMIAKKAAEVFNAPATSLMLWDEGKENLVIRAKWGLSDEYAQQQRIPGEKVCAAGETTGEFQPLLTPDLQLGPFGDIDLIKRERLRTVLSAPLVVGDQLTGILNIYSQDKPRQFTSYEQELAQVFANQAAIAVQNAQFYAGVQSRAQQLQDVLNAGQNVTALRPIRDVLQAITDSLVANFGYDAVTLFPYRAESRTFDPPVISGHLYFSHIVLGKVTGDTQVEKRLRGPEFHFTSNSPDDDLLAGRFTRREGIQASGYVRLNIGHEVVGVLFVNHRKPHTFTDDEQRAVRLFANQAAIAIHNTRQFEALQNQLGQLEMTLAASQGIMMKQPLRETLQAILDQLVRVEGYDVATLILYRPGRGAFGHTLVAGQLRHYPKAIGQFRKDSVAERRLKEGPDEYFTSDAANDPLLGGSFVKREGICAVGSIRMKHGEQPVGLLFVNKREPHQFTAREQKALRLYASQAAVALHEARLFYRGQERMEILIRIGQKVGRSPRLKMLDTLLADLQTIFGPDTNPNVLLYDESNQTLRFQYTKQSDLAVDAEGRRGQRTIKVGEGVCGWVAEHKRALNVRNVHVDPRYLQVLPTIQSELAVPILLGERLVGVLDIQSPVPGKFSDNDQYLLKAVANQVAAAVRNAEQYERLERQQKQLLALHESTKVITASIDRDRTLQAILAEAVRLTGAHIATIQEKREDHLSFEAIYPAEKKAQVISQIGASMPLSGPGITVKVANTGQPCLENDVLAVPTFVDGLNGAARSELAVPLLDEDEIRGVLNVEHVQPGAFDENDKQVLQSLAELAVIAIKNAERAEQLARSEMLALMGAWGAEVTHDVNREVGAIRRAIWRLQRNSELPSPVKTRLQEIDRYAEDLALPELPKQPPVSGLGLRFRDACPLDAVIAAEIDHLRDVHPTLSFRKDLNCQGVWAAMHKQWLRRLLRHLIRNALNAISEKEERMMTVRTGAQGSMVAVQVEDTGKGVRPEIIPLLFRRPIPHEDGHQGCGLLVVRSVVEQHGGQASLVWTRPGKGACFAFSIPIAEREQVAQRAEQ